ncbi:MAG: hypothetical protein AAGA66_15065 [Bacteroidota bacterium]
MKNYHLSHVWILIACFLIACNQDETPQIKEVTSSEDIEESMDALVEITPMDVFENEELFELINGIKEKMSPKLVDEIMSGTVNHDKAQELIDNESLTTFTSIASELDSKPSGARVQQDITCGQVTGAINEEMAILRGHALRDRNILTGKSVFKNTDPDNERIFRQMFKNHVWKVYGRVISLLAFRGDCTGLSNSTKIGNRNRVMYIAALYGAADKTMDREARKHNVVWRTTRTNKPQGLLKQFNQNKYMTTVPGHSTNQATHTSSVSKAHQIVLDIHNQFSDPVKYLTLWNQTLNRRLDTKVGTSESTAKFSTKGSYRDNKHKFVFEPGRKAGEFRLKSVKNNKYLIIRGQYYYTNGNGTEAGCHFSIRN